MHAVTAAPPLTVSVLICTYNRHELLAGALHSLFAADPLPNEVVIVNGGDDRANSAVAPYLDRSDVRVHLIKTRNINLAASRNVGLRHCTGEIVAMTDDDAEVFPDWIAQIRQTLARYPDAGAVGGLVIGVGRSLVSRLADQVTFPRPAAGPVRTVPGVNVAYTRAALAVIGLQDETLFRGEDVDFNWRLHRAGYQIYFDPAIQVYHHHRPTLRRLLQQHYMYGRAYYFVRRKWPEMYCVYPHALRRPRDLLKALNFGVAVLYEPLLHLARIEGTWDRIMAYPLMLALQIVWRGGMVREHLAAARSSGASRA
ncbi:MAG TPA: glycosyltransferase [Chloroflexia bacterium]|nr:glycosyltransferase [Chloroflexia bacterium]